MSAIILIIDDHFCHSAVGTHTCTHLDAGLGDAALAGAGVLDDDEGVLAAPRQVLLRLPPPRLQPQLVQVHQPENRRNKEPGWGSYFFIGTKLLLQLLSCEELQFR